MRKQVSYYQLGVELLNEQTKIPIEHLEYEEEHDLETALDIYESWVIDENCAKYMYKVMKDGEMVLMFSEGYKED